MSKEIERKWLLQGFPMMIQPDETFDVWQGYINTDPEVRIHLKSTLDGLTRTYKMTVKGDGALVRTEIEFEIPEKQYDLLAEHMVKHPLIYKDYRKYKLLDGHIAQASCVDHGVFSYVEVEFDTEEDAHSFKAPTWFGEEVTHNPRYKMKNYFVSEERMILMNKGPGAIPKNVTTIRNDDLTEMCNPVEFEKPKSFKVEVLSSSGESLTFTECNAPCVDNLLKWMNPNYPVDLFRMDTAALKTTTVFNRQNVFAVQITDNE